MFGTSKLTKKQAESILGLPPNYTADDIKKAYRKAAKKNAKALVDTAAKEENKQLRIINEAHAVLIGKTAPAPENNPINWADFTDSIVKNREELVKKLKKRLDFPFSKCASYLIKIINQCKMIINDYEIKILFGLRANKESYAEAEAKLNDKLKELEIIFLDKNGISKEDIGEMDYTLSIGDFFNELLQRVKNKNYSVGKIAALKEKLVVEGKKYTEIYNNLQAEVNKTLEEAILSSIIKGYVGNPNAEEKVVSVFKSTINDILLDRIEKNLQKEKENFCTYGYAFLSAKMDDIIKVLLDNFKSNIDSLEDLLTNFKSQVDELIKKYYESLSLIEELTNFVNTIELLIGETEETIEYKDRIATLDRKLKQGDNVGNSLNNLNNDIRGYYTTIERKLDLSSNEAIKSSYGEFERKYHKKMQSLNPIKDINTIKIMNELLSEMINLFNSLIIGVVDVKDFLECIKATKFDDIAGTINRIKECSLGKSFVYINVKDISQFGYARRFFLLKEEDGNLFMYYKVSRDYQPDTLRRIEVTPEELRENFESIESILNRSNYIGYLLKNDRFTSTYVLYSCPELSIQRLNDYYGRSNSRFRIVERNNTNYSNKRFEVNENAGYSDRRELIAEIKKRFEEMYNTEKEKKPSNRYYYKY